MGHLADHGGWPAVLEQLVAGRDLSADAARAAMDEILAGEATPAQLGAFVVALRTKGEAVAELNGMLDAMLDAALLVPLSPGL
ncbi:MAG TPA: anthranilate phosphoribosyltransferase, partial [Acidimicrobiales bacterium]